MNMNNIDGNIEKTSLPITYILEVEIAVHGCETTVIWTPSSGIKTHGEQQSEQRPTQIFINVEATNSVIPVLIDPGSPI